MRLQSLLVALALAASVQAYTITGYNEINCLGSEAGTTTGTQKTACASLGTNKWKSIRADPGDFVLTAFGKHKETSSDDKDKCQGNGYALQPGHCVNLQKNDEFQEYSVQFIAIKGQDPHPQDHEDECLEDYKSGSDTSL
ncbi:hypothetical protein BO70DRAFT_393054 [Aspergillus heteromorphus CBS 117.55]|uniref:Secreted protein n=1 Tax=Aspergillus heteromorphus CBS 117.55 TaxID=1448321 RepID=A0A317WWZ4_9EURO|nr:uncharacterized protein BO70DRAFT_393054 [Aspergillus heteromorphus CBS 117.55]PWY89852.1 hypothetical protein BO70DRAFT_393054 [Aspergillus heteromorphus CBS 117.55]